MIIVNWVFANWVIANWVLPIKYLQIVLESQDLLSDQVWPHKSKEAQGEPLSPIDKVQENKQDFFNFANKSIWLIVPPTEKKFFWHTLT